MLLRISPFIFSFWVGEDEQKKNFLFLLLCAAEVLMRTQFPSSSHNIRGEEKWFSVTKFELMSWRDFHCFTSEHEKWYQHNVTKVFVLFFNVLFHNARCTFVYIFIVVQWNVITNRKDTNTCFNYSVRSFATKLRNLLINFQRSCSRIFYFHKHEKLGNVLFRTNLTIDWGDLVLRKNSSWKSNVQ